MFVGKTHSGKTTVARLLAIKNNYVVIDVDEIDQFCKKEYGVVVDFEKRNREFYSQTDFKPFLKLQIQSTVFKYAISCGLGVILSNGHGRKVSKEHQKQIAKELDIKLIAVNFRIDDETIKQRIKDTNKDLKILTVSKDFYQALDSQNKVFAFADKTDTDYILDIDATKSSEQNVDEIVSFISSLS